MREDDHFYTACQCVERDALWANLMANTRDWRWSSLWHRHHHTGVPWLTAGTLSFPENWTATVQAPQTQAEYAALQRSVSRAHRLAIRIGWSQPPDGWA